MEPLLKRLRATLRHSIKRFYEADKVLIARVILASLRSSVWLAAYRVLSVRIVRRGRFRLFGWVTVTNAGHGSEIRLSRGCTLDSGRIALAPTGVLEIGPRTSLNYGFMISAVNQIKIGSDCLIAEYVTIRDNDHTFSATNIPIKTQGLNSRPIVIEDDVWLARGVAILKGVTIGRGAVVGANAVVTRDVPPYAVVVGVPAKIVRFRTAEADLEMKTLNTDLGTTAN